MIPTIKDQWEAYRLAHPNSTLLQAYMCGALSVFDLFVKVSEEWQMPDEQRRKFFSDVIKECGEMAVSQPDNPERN